MSRRLNRIALSALLLLPGCAASVGDTSSTPAVTQPEAGVQPTTFSCPPCGTPMICDSTKGVCVFPDECNEPKMRCEGVCVDPTKDKNNCGRCGKVCTGDAECIDRKCATAPCDPSEPGVCGGTDVFCYENERSCLSCGPGFANCDLDTVCECEGACVGEICLKSECKVSEENSCGDNEKIYCAGSDGCKFCEDGKKNSDGVKDCES